MLNSTKGHQFSVGDMVLIDDDEPALRISSLIDDEGAAVKIPSIGLKYIEFSRLTLDTKKSDSNEKEHDIHPREEDGFPSFGDDRGVATTGYVHWVMSEFEDMLLQEEKAMELELKLKLELKPKRKLKSQLKLNLLSPKSRTRIPR